MESLNDLIWSDEESEISTLTIDTKPIMRHACMVFMRKVTVILYLIMLLACTACRNTESVQEQGKEVSPTTAQQVLWEVPEKQESSAEEKEEKATPTEAASKYQYTEEKDISFYERHGYAMFNSNRGFSAKTERITYYLPQSMKEAERDAIIDETERLLDLIEDRLGTLDLNAQKAAINMCKVAYRPTLQDGTLCVGYPQFQTQEYITGLIRLCLGNETNHGIMYGFGYHIAQEAGYELDDISESLAEALSICDEEAYYLDMNYACFLDAYAEKEVQEKLKRIAVAFWTYLEENKKLELYTDYSDEKYCEYLSTFLMENGKSAYDNSDLCNTRFYGSGRDVRLIWENEDAVYYLLDDYVENPSSSFVLEDTVNTGYRNLRMLIVTYREQIEYVKQQLGEYAVAGKTEVVFTIADPYYKKVSGIIYYEKQEIHIFGNHALVHEYTHYLLRESGIPSWLNEAICHYYDNHFSMRKEINYSVQGLKRKMEMSQNEEVHKLFQKVVEHCGDDFDWYERDDYYCFIAAFVTYHKAFSHVYEPISQLEGDCFYNYLVELQGEEATLEAIMESKPEEVFGMDWDALVDDWIATYKERYAWVYE